MKKTLLRTAIIIFILITLVASKHLVQAQRSVPLDSIAREQTWVTNGPFEAIAQNEDNVYIGGGFTYVGPNNGHGAPVDIVNGELSGTFPKVNGTIRASVTDGTGGWYIGGDFSKVGGISRKSIAHILSDGTVNPDWNPNPDRLESNFVGINSILVSGPTIYVGGIFDTIGGQSRNSIAALDATTGDATPWDPNAIRQETSLLAVVNTISISGSTIFVGGLFTNIGRQAREGIAALDNNTGDATSWNPNASNVDPRIALIRTTLISGSTIYIGGQFSNIGGQSRNNIAALDINSALATSWNPDADDTVRALATNGTLIYAGGSFSSIGGQNRNAIAALDNSIGNATAWNPDPIRNCNCFVRINALEVSGSTVFAGGVFDVIGGQNRFNLAALDDISGNATSWIAHANDDVLSLAISNSTIYAGGRFSSIGGLERNHIAALDKTTGVATDWNPNANLAVSTLDINSTSTILVGGLFTNVGGQPRNYIAELDLITGNATSWNPDANNFIRDFVTSGTTVFVSGDFTNIGGQSRNGIAALDTNSNNALAWNPSFDPGIGSVIKMAISGSSVYVVGRFSSIGGQNRNHIAALDVTTGNATDWNPSASGGLPNTFVFDLAVSDSTVYVGGEFARIGGQERNNIAALDKDSGMATAWNPDANNDISAIALSGSTLYVGGSFVSIGGQNRNTLASISTETGKAFQWDPSARSFVLEINIYDSTLYASGFFSKIGDNEHEAFAQFDILPPTLNITFPITGALLPRGDTHTIIWTRTGEIGPTVNIFVLGGSSTTLQALSVPNTGFYDLLIPTSLEPRDDYRLLIISTNNGAVNDISDPFEIFPNNTAAQMPWQRLE